MKGQIAISFLVSAVMLLSVSHAHAKNKEVGVNPKCQSGSQTLSIDQRSHAKSPCSSNNASELNKKEKKEKKEKQSITSSIVSGRIITVSGAAIENVNVTAFDTSGLIQAVSSKAAKNGEFTLQLEAETQYVLRLSAPNYGNKVVPITSPSADNALRLNNVIMAERGEVQSISQDGDRKVIGADGASVTFDKSNFVDMDGQPLLGDMQLTITPLDISNTRSVQAFPGLFQGMSSESVTPQMIASLGIVEFHFTQNGEPVNLASGSTADVLIPIYVNQYPNGQAIEAGDTTPLRSLNETTGIWSQEGVGTVVYSTESPTGLAYSATVQHFSWWGTDVAMVTSAGDTTANTGLANAVITLNAPAGIAGFAVIEAFAPDLVNWRGDTVSINLDIGNSTPNLYIPANRNVCFTAFIYFASGTTSTTNQECVNVASQATVNLYMELGQTGPIDVTVTPKVNDDTAFIQGYVNVQSPALSIAPTTIETSIDYQLLSGTLPAGLSLDIFDNVVNLVGIPTSVGEETFVIRANDIDGNIDDVTITYNTSSVSPPPIIEYNINRIFEGEITTLNGSTEVNLNDLVTNIGGPITEWREVTSTVDQGECTDMYDNQGVKGASDNLSLSTAVILNPTTGQLTFNSPELWISCLKAVNDQGSSIFLFGFEITNVSPPPIIESSEESFIVADYNSFEEPLQIDLNEVITNYGGPITQWEEINSGSELDQCISIFNSKGLGKISEDQSLPESITLDDATGLITFNYGEIWFGCLKAVNTQGESVFIFGFNLTSTAANE